MSEQYNTELIKMLQKTICFKRDYWHSEANRLLKEILGEDWQKDFWKRQFAEEDLRKELSDE